MPREDGLLLGNLQASEEIHGLMLGRNSQRPPAGLMLRVEVKLLELTDGTRVFPLACPRLLASMHLPNLSR